MYKGVNKDVRRRRSVKRYQAGGQLQMPTGNVGDLIQGRSFRGGLENLGMDLRGQGQNLMEGIKGGKIGLSGAAGLLGAGAEKLISKGSATASDPFRTDKKQRTGAAVGGAVKGAGKGFDIGNKIIPGLGGAIGAGIGAIGGLFKARKGQEGERKAAVKELRRGQNEALRASAFSGPDPFSSKAGAGFNTATSATKAYDQVSRAKFGGERKLPGGKASPLPGGAVEFIGKKHNQGGIMLDKMTEVEGGETMDKVNMKKSGGQAKDYIFSDYLKLGGKTFANRHKELLKGGASQKDIQNLAKMQEKKAGRTPKVMQTGGTADLLAGLGEGNFSNDMSGEEAAAELSRAATNARNQGRTPEDVEAARAERDRVVAENEAKRAARAEAGAKEKAKEDGSGRIYGGNQEDQIGTWLQKMESDMQNLPEENRNFDFSKYKNEDGTFNPDAFNSKEEKGKFREWYNNLPNDLVSGKISAKNDAGDLVFGEQWASTNLLQRPPEPKELNYEEVEMDVKIPDPVEGPEPEQPEGTVAPETQVNKKRDVPLGALLAGASQLIPPAYALLKKPTRVPGYAPQSYAKPQLPRVNFNAERSSNASDMRATMASIENNAGGPAGMVNMIAAMGKKRQGDLQIANAESRANKQLAADEAKLGARTSEFNIGQDAAAQTFNRQLAREQIKDRREEVMGALDAAADRVAGITGDVLDYKGQERLAEATSGETGVLLREELRRSNPNMSEEEIATLAAQMQEKGQRGGGKVKKQPSARRQARIDGRKAIRNARRGTAGPAAPVPVPQPQQQKRGGYIKGRKRVQRRR